MTLSGLADGRIFVDISSAVHQKAGLKRYSENLVRHLEPHLGARLGLFQNDLGRTTSIPGLAEHMTVGVRWGYRPWRGLVWLRHRLKMPMDALLPDAALFHATEHLLPPLEIPTVLTVHDLIYERFPKYHKLKNYLYLHAAMPLYCARASAIIAISESTKRDLQSYYGVAPSKITVIPEAAAPSFTLQPEGQIETVRCRYGLPPRYLLTVGTLEPRKNLMRLVDACGPLFAENLLDGLVIVGAKGWLYEEFFEHLDKIAWRERVVLPGFVADADLPAVYAGALVTVQPSLYEGFGLPVLEAMACGSPVIASRTSSFPEVGGLAARYFEPEDADAITLAAREVLVDDTLASEMRQVGTERAKSFTWERTALETMALYDRVLKGGS